MFCAGLLLGSDLPPRDGLSADVGASYATLSRRLDLVAGAFDASDVTPKFALVGVGQARQPTAGLGTGTPELEWRARVALGPSHDEQRRRFTDEVPITATGTGRYVNFAAVGRLPFGPSDSLELGLERREHEVTDFSNFVADQPPVLFVQRSLTARRLDAAAGWRHRWKGLELAASLRWIRPSGRSENDETLYRSRGSLVGGAAEARWRLGRWTLSFVAERASGSLHVDERSAPAGVDREVRGDALLRSLRPGVSYSSGRTEIFASLSFDRQNLPFVSLAVLAAESAALQAGRHLDSAVDEVFWDVRVRRAFARSLSALLALRLGYGLETVTISDSTGAVLSRLNLRRRGIFGGGLSGQLGSPALTFFLGANFAVGAAP